jgi:DNA polymerase (family 10)
LNNREVAQVFDTIADLLEIKGEAIYRVLAYRRAAESLRTLGRDVNSFWQEGSLRSIAGVGEAIASKIDELLSTGHIAFYDKLTSEMPAGLVDVLQVGDVGPKKARRFWKELNITSIEGLEQAARQGELAQLSGMGAKSEARILENIEALKHRQTGRVSIGVALPTAEALLGELRALDSVERAEAAGSVRRMRETVGDLDLLVASSDGPAVMEAFVHFPQIARVLGRGDTKSSVELHDGLRVQVWVHPSEHFGTALQYATGSQAHNVRLRELALDQGLSLSEHGFKTRQGKELFCSTEEEVYATLGLPWIPPELREDRGEIKAAQEDQLPDLIEESDLRGELHAHTDWSDGSVSLEIMAQAAVEFGLDYLVISDHTQSLGVANGLSPERLEAQRKEIDKLQRKLGDRLVLLHGAEVEILADGRLDLPDEVLSRLDIVVASLHTSLRQPRPQVTARLLGAIASRNVDVIGHPSGRLIGSRDPADLDMEAVLQAASEHDTALEINANPERLDLNDGYARRAAGLGCLLTIDTDAHRPEHLSLRRYGVGPARRAWLPAEAVLNTWPLDRLRDWLNSRK